MADFKMKLFTLAGAATIFAGMAFGQAVVSSTTGVASNAIFVRGEGTTEQVADSTVTFTGNAAVASATLQVFLSPTVAITSKAVTSSINEASAVIGGVNVAGTVSGNSVTFTGIAIPIGGGTVTITNIRVNASTIATGSGIPAAISETIFVSGTNVTPNVPNAVTVAYVQAGLGKTTSSGISTANVICTATTSAASSFTVNVAEGFATAFKSQGAAGQALGVWNTANTETGYSTGIANVANSGTRISVTFANVPANVAVYVPVSVQLPALTAAGVPAATSQITLTTSATAAFSAVAASAATGAPAAVNGIGAAAVTIANGTGTAVYEVTTNNPAAVETYAIPVYLVAAAGAIPAPTTAITATVSLAPIGSTNIPNFVSNASTLTVNGSVWTACSSVLLFPFVTNQAGFESGLAISNTSTDLLKAGATPATSVTAQSGTCLLTFFGNATAASNPASFTTPVISAGTTWTNTLTAVSGGTAGNFGGYMIASCNFLFGHGFTYISYNIGQSSGMAMGYLALELPGTRAASTAAPESLTH